MNNTRQTLIGIQDLGGEIFFARIEYYAGESLELFRELKESDSPMGLLDGRVKSERFTRLSGPVSGATLFTFLDRAFYILPKRDKDEASEVTFLYSRKHKEWYVYTVADYDKMLRR